MISIMGTLLATLGLLLGVGGSWFVTSKSDGDRCIGFVLWMVGNPINTFVILGVIFGWWSALPLLFMLISQIYFFFTAYKGWRNCK